VTTLWKWPEKMSKDEKPRGKTTRRDFLKGVGAGAVVAAAAVAGVEEYRMVQQQAVIPTPTPVPPQYSKTITLNVNGADYTFTIDNRWTLVDVLREKLGLAGTKVWCDNGECGACTVLVDGKPMLSCITLAVEAEGKKVLTIEGLRTSSGELHPIQQAFVDHDGLQCGVCTPGMIMTTKALLDANPHPTEEQVRQALSGNVCRCGAYPKIVESVLAAAKGGA
jgi:aerobic-type carbon monoxide dehydrogenase small subunit (CoxS/CutS family)